MPRGRDFQSIVTIAFHLISPSLVAQGSSGLLRASGTHSGLIDLVASTLLGDRSVPAENLA